MKQKKTNTLFALVLCATTLLTTLMVNINTYAQTISCQWGATVDNSNIGRKSLAIDKFGNEYVAGNFYAPFILVGRDTLFNHSTWTSDFYVAKYNHLGNLIWVRSVGGSQHEYAGGVTVDPMGNVLVTGTYQTSHLVIGHDTLQWGGNVFVVKYDSSGNVLWARASSGGGVISGGITSDNEGNSYIAGYYGGAYISFGHDSLYDGFNRIENLFITKYSPSGNVLWVKGNANLGDGAEPTDIKSTPSGNIYVTGNFRGRMIVFGNDTLKKDRFVDNNVFTLKMDKNGNLLWDKGIGNFYNTPLPLLGIDNNDNAIVYCKYVDLDFVIGTDTIAAGPGDALLVKYDSSGNLVWAKKKTYHSTTNIVNMICDPFGYFYLGGNFNKANLSFGSDSLIKNDTSALCILKYDNDGNEVWAKGAQNSENNTLAAIAADDYGNIYVSGSFGGKEILLDAITISGDTSIYQHSFLARLGGVNVGVVNTTPYINRAIVYPNPVSTIKEIHLSFPENEYSMVEIFNNIGQKLMERNIGQAESLMNLSLNNVVPGQYFIRLIGYRNCETLPLIITK